MGVLNGRVALVTGAARAQGRSHFVRLAQAGADVVALDICGEAAPIAYPVATRVDLSETVRLVEALGRRIVPRVGDVRDETALDAAVADAVALVGSTSSWPTQGS